MRGTEIVSGRVFRVAAVAVSVIGWLGGVSVHAQVVTGTAAFTHPPAGAGAASARTPDRIWSTQPAAPPTAAPPNGVVVLVPNVVLGWGGLPPSGPPRAGPVHGSPAHGPGSVPGRPPSRHPPPGPAMTPPPGTLHVWRSP